MNTKNRRDVPPATRRGLGSGLKMSLLAMSALFILTLGTVQAAIDPTTVQKLIPEDGTDEGFVATAASLSADGRTALIGSFSGIVYVFKFKDGQWTTHAKLTPAGTEPIQSTGFGGSLALSADGGTALIGNVFSEGEVYVFRATAGGWVQEAKLPAGTLPALALSADGNTALIGNMHADAAFVFNRTADGDWREQSKLTAKYADGFGRSVSLSSDGKTALIGAPGNENQAGTAYIFTRSENGNWEPYYAGPLTASDKALQDNFGTAVSLSGDGHTAMIGAVDFDKESGSQTGSFYIFRFGNFYSTDFWLEHAKLPGVPNMRVLDETVYFNSLSLSADGSTALIGTPEDDGGKGSAYLFTASGSNWTQQPKLTLPTRISDEKLFGFAVSLAANGKTALIGSYVLTDLVQPPNEAPPTPKP